MDFQEKIKQLKQALEKNPQKAYLWQQLSQLLWQQNAEECQKYIEKALLIRPQSPPLLQQRRHILIHGLFTLGSPNFRHGDEITQVYVSPENRIFSASKDATIKLWDISGKLLQTFQGHQGPVLSFDLHPHRPWLLSTSTDQSIRIWDTRTGENLHTIHAHKSTVYRAKFSRDGQRMISASHDGQCLIWQINPQGEAKILLAFEKHKNPVLAIDISEDGKLVASGDSQGNCLLWPSHNPKIGKVLSGHQGKIHHLQFSKNKRQLLSCGEDATIRLWDTTQGKEIQQFLGHQKAVLYATFLPEEERILSTSADATIRLWQLQPPTELRRLEGHSQSVNWISVHPNEMLAVSAGKELFLRQWHFQKGYQVNQPLGPTHKILSLDCQHYLLLLLENPNSATLWNPLSGKRLKEFKCLEPQLSTDNPTTPFSPQISKLSPDQQHFAVAGKEGKIQVWNHLKEIFIFTFDKHQTPITSLDFSPQGGRIASGDEGGEVLLWDIDDGFVRAGGNLNMGKIHAVKFFPSGNLLSIATDQTCLVMNLENAEEYSRFSQHQSPVQYICTSANNIAVTADLSSKIFVWKTKPQQEAETLLEVEEEHSPLAGICFLQRPNTLLAAYQNGILYAFDLRKKEKIFKNHTGQKILALTPFPAEAEILLCLENGCIQRLPEYHIL
ncbi:MAG: WD40 repeat domain-containing protein [Planctomycetota bacterium]|nr:MAG: WD40 repeat domain-containing protein [Planctomycetota bacterium]